MAPEALKGQTCLKSDIWSAGVLLHFLLTGNHPFHGKNQKRIQNAIERGVPDLN
jgi:serine/threonine protein kinase